MRCVSGGIKQTGGKSVGITPETHIRLIMLKYKLGFKNMDELINFLIDKYLENVIEKELPNVERGNTEAIDNQLG